jgi:hypothetical protein
MKNSTTRILTIAVVFLLLTNIGLIIFMLMGKGNKADHSRGRRAPFEMMAKELNLSGEQEKAFIKLNEEHFKTIRPLFDSVRVAKTAFFDLAKDSTAPDSLVAAYNRRVLEKQSELDMLTFSHFRSVRKMLNPDQQVKYDSLIRKMMMRGGKRDSSKKKAKQD